MSQDKQSSKIESLIYFLLVLFISNTAQICFEPTFKYAVVVLFLAIYRYRLQKVDTVIVSLFFYWFSINLICSLNFGTSFVFNNILGYFLNVFIAYFAMKIIGVSFWEKLEKWIYVLTCISLILFVGNLLTGGLYDSLSPLFGRFIAKFYTDARPTAWYIFVYTYSPIEGFDYLRNSGFMWESGAFAMMAVLGFIYRICKNEMSFDRHCLVYVLAIISTFSSAGYLSILLFLLYYCASRRNFIYTILLLCLAFIAIPKVYQLEFMSDKLANYLEELNSNTAYYNERLDMDEYNRFTVFEINMKRLIEWPLGYGVNGIKDFYGKSFVGVNGLAIFARMWGLCGFVLLVYSISKTVRKLNLNVSQTASFIFLLMILVMFFSNPIESSVLPWFFCLTPFIYKKNKNILL